MATIVTKNSSTASAVPTTSDLVQGELAVNVTDKRIFTENASAQIVELGTNPSTITTATATVTGTLTANGTFASNNAVITGGSINSTPIGATTPSTVRGSTVTATTGFVGGLTGNVTGNLTGNVTGNVVGNLTGNVTGNVTASTGTTTLNNLVVNGTADFTNTKLTNITTPTLDSDAANKGYVDATVAAVIDSAPAALDTLNELAAALGDDANFSATVTTALATKLPLAGGTMSGAIAMGTSKITGLGDPTASQDAATKIYVDTADNLKLNLSGGTMSGAIAMGTNKITGLGDPTLAQDAATKAYTDSILGSATSAAASAAAAATSESNAATSASNASTSETNALNSANAAASSYDQFDDRYLGDKTSDPTLDNDGNALLTGALYFNTTTDVMRVYNGSAWQDTALSPNSPTFTGTVTADGLTVNGDASVITLNNTDTSLSLGQTLGEIKFNQNDPSDQGVGTVASIEVENRGAIAGYGQFNFKTGSATSLLDRLSITEGGDISFYEDTGTTPKFFWDASAESLGIGTTSPTAKLQIQKGSNGEYLRIGGDDQSDGNRGLRFTSSSSASFVGAVHDINAPSSQGVIALSTNSTERLRIDSSGNVGIGEAPNSNSKLQILDTAATANNYTVHMRSYQPTIVWNDISGASTDFAIQVDTSAMMFQYGDAGTGTKLASEAMRIDASGNLLVGKTASGITTAGIELRADNTAYFTRDEGIPILVNRETSDGGLIQLRKDNTTVGSIVATGGRLAIGDGDTGLRFAGDFDNIQPFNVSTLALRDSAIDLGSGVGRFKDLYLSGTANVANVKETVYALTGTALDAGNGGIQTKTLAANTTFTDSLASGESLVLQLEAGASYTVTWPTMTWVTSGGNVAPTLTAKDTLVFWKVSTTLYGAYTGSYV